MFSTLRSHNTTSLKASQISACWKEEVGESREGRWSQPIRGWTRGVVRSPFTLKSGNIKVSLSSRFSPIQTLSFLRPFLGFFS